MHVLDVSSVFDCAHSSITSANSSKHTNATKTTKRGHKSTYNNKKPIGSSVERALQKNVKPHEKQKCKKKEFPKIVSETQMKKANSLNDKQSGPTSGNIWTQVVQTVQDTQNFVMMVLLLVLIYLFCYDRTVRP